MRSAVEARLRPGLTKEEVVDLLGLPDERRSEDEYVYDAGSGGPTQYSDRLSLRFDAQGRLESWRIEKPDPTLS